MTVRTYLYRCRVCGKEKTYKCSGMPPSFIMPTCDNHQMPNIVMELIKEVDGDEKTGKDCE